MNSFTKSMLRIFIVMFCFVVLGKMNANAQWTYAVPITITNTVSTVVNNYQVPIYINTSTPIGAGQMLSSGNDIRFANTCTGGTFYNYYIDSGFNSTKTKIWVLIDNIPASGNKVIFLLYGNSSASAASTLNTFNGPYSSTNQVTGGTAGGATLSQRGFRFSPNHLIIVSQFGKKEPTGTTRFVTIFDMNTTAIVAQGQVPGATTNYVYANLTNPLWLNKNQQYTVQLFQGTGDGYYYGTSSQINSNLTYYDMKYCNSCTQNTFPTSTLSNYHYGYPDFTFYTCDTNNISSPPTVSVGTGSGSGPSLTLGTNPSVCAGSTSAPLTYTSSGAPTTYSIVWSSGAITAGFANVTNAALPASPILITVPGAAAANTYTGTLTAANSCGTSTGYSISVTITSSIPITTQPTNVSACTGGNASFTVAGTGVTGYQWQVNTGSGFVNVTNTGVYTNATTATLNITGATAGMNGYIYRCILSSGSCSSLASNSATLSVGNISPTISISTGTTSVCAGASVTFSSTVANAGSTPTYQWQRNGINIGTNSSTFTSTALNNADVITCILTGSGSCAASITSNAITMTVNPVVVPTISISTSNNPVCASGTAVFNATIVNGGSSPAYQWRRNGTNVSTTPSYSFNGFSSGDVVSCILTSNAVCATPPSVNSNNITMTVNPIVTPSVTINTSSLTVCSGQNTTFTASPVNGGGTPFYQWQINGFPVGTNSATFTTAALANGDVVSCFMTSNAPCPNPSAILSNTITMTVVPTVVPTISINSNVGIQACVGVPTTFNATITNGGTAPLYQWRRNGSPVGTNSPTYIAPTLNNGDIISCILASTAVCAIPASVNSNNMTMVVSPVGKATVGIVASPDSIICTPSSGVLFYSNFTNGGTAPAYQWVKNGIDMPGETNATLNSNSLAHNDRIAVRFISNAICVFPETSKEITVQRYPRLSLGVNIKIEDLGTQGTRFTANVVNGGTNPLYQWRKNEKPIPTETNSTYTASGLTSSDRISEEVTSNAICASPKSLISTNATTGIQVTKAGTMQLALYPNPVTEGQLYITTDKSLSGKTQLRVLDRLGSVVCTKDVELNTSIPATIEVGHLASGIYILQAVNTTENVKANIRFTKQ